MQDGEKPNLLVSSAAEVGGVHEKRIYSNIAFLGERAVIFRTLFITVGAKTDEVPVRLHQPTEADGYWECRFEIGWPDGAKKSRARGFDGVQAVYAAMQNVAVLLYASPYHSRGELHWGKPGTGYGFPMPVVGYDTLIGEDRVAQVRD